MHNHEKQPSSDVKDNDQGSEARPQCGESIKGGTLIAEEVRLHKPFTTLTAMGLGHSITNTAITLLVGMSSSIALGGPPLFIWGFVAMAVVGVAVSVSLGELASALPHTGGQYFWVAVLGPPRFRRFLSYITGIVAWAAAICTTASVCLVVPIMIFNMVSIRNPDFIYQPWMGFVGYQIINIFLFLFNLYSKCLPYISSSLLIFTVSSLIVMFVSMLAVSSPKQDPSRVFVDLYNSSGWPDGVAFLIGINAPSWGFSSLDAVVHLADEIPNPRRNIPKALLLTVTVGSFTGILILLSAFFSATNLENIATSTTPSLQIFYQAFGGNLAAAVGLQALVTVSAAGSIIGIHTWQSRMAWAFSRDKGFPFHRYLNRIAPEPFATPIYAHIWSCAWTALLGCLYLGSQLAFNSLVSAGMLLQYITYSTSIVCLLWYGRSNLRHGPFWFPRFGLVCNIITVIWSLTAVVFYSFPYYFPTEADQMNYVSCVIVGVFLYALLYWVLFGKREFSPPQPEYYD
ncbi:unnamed protein product [Clonostachys rosea f. rosea IK726]|uniref:Uncharacterized protein n=1 Tax=Clonostachys rosea f. rosea IK726 TaxID=1349383 RepID=A0ACA9UH53_BIOOC|nr:unnamed protein product [Clonostachys rosea f. rosea IK726]